MALVHHACVQALVHRACVQCIYAPASTADDPVLTSPVGAVTNDVAPVDPPIERDAPNDRNSAS
eukprot:10221821-Ditylum_brightwellii.AAC.1